MTRAAIFEAITAERARQDEKHPVAFSCLLNTLMYDPKNDALVEKAKIYKEANDLLEKIGEHSAYGLTMEELYEFFAETDKARQVEEAIQNAALWVRIIEEITK